MIAVVDYHKGNLKSVERGLASVGLDARITDDLARIREADGIVLPGVGSFTDAATSMSELGQMELVRERILAGVPFLGICLGEHLLFEGGVEHAASPDEPTPGLGILPGIVGPLPRKDAQGMSYKIPHVGWNIVHPTRPGHPLFDGLYAEEASACEEPSAEACGDAPVEPCEEPSARHPVAQTHSLRSRTRFVDTSPTSLSVCECFNEASADVTLPILQPANAGEISCGSERLTDSLKISPSRLGAKPRQCASALASSDVSAPAKGAYFYFTHSYAVPESEATIATTCHSIEFPSAVQYGDVCFGVQFHPEKSSDEGLQLLRNFARICAQA